MPEYVCKKNSQIRNEAGKIQFFSKGSIVSVTKDPGKNFQQISEDVKVYKIDFLKAKAAELKTAKWKPADAAKAVKEAYDVDLDLEGAKKADVIKQILDARYRNTSSPVMPAK